MMKAKHGFIMSGLEALIGELWKLYLAISSRITNDRTDRSDLGGGETSDVRIAESLYSHIEMFEKQRSSELSGLTDRPTVLSRSTTSAPNADDNSRMKRSARVGNDLFNELSNSMKSRSSVAVQPPIVEKLRASAEEHIKKSISLAKRDEPEAARIHARLAESAVKAAVDYMSASDYEEFKRQIDERASVIIRAHDASDSS